MSRLTITCDRQEGLIRCAVWQGKTLVDLYVDHIDQPDMTGAVVCGKVVRTASGGSVAWVECGLAEKIYLESKAPVKAGEFLTLRIVSTIGQGKAWIGAVEKTAPATQEIGVVVPPPLPWQRALGALAANQQATFLFRDKIDYEAFVPSGAVKAELSLKEPVHPDLAEQIDALLEPVVALGAGPSLVIEPTQALVAIDVNGGESTNATSVNLLAVREAARQIRLRNLSGIVVIDCLKMKDRVDVSKVLNAFTRVVESDPCKVHVFGMSKLGLLEATRTRKGPSLADIMKR